MGLLNWKQIDMTLFVETIALSGKCLSEINGSEKEYGRMK
jgi:hypothetical protein